MAAISQGVLLWDSVFCAWPITIVAGNPAQVVYRKPSIAVTPVNGSERSPRPRAAEATG